MESPEIFFITIALLAVAFILAAFFIYRSHQKAKTKVKIILFNVVLVLGLLTFGLTLAESYYQFFFDSTHGDIRIMVSQKWLRKYEQLNNLLYRDNVDYNLKKDSTTRRITFLGDSFGAGYGIKDVDKRFANIIRKHHRDWEVQNFSRPGHDTGHHIKNLQAFRDMGGELDEVLYVYYVNDMLDLDDYNKQWQDVEYPEEPFLVQHSYFINFVYYNNSWIEEFISGADFPDVPYYRGEDEIHADDEMWAIQEMRLDSMKNLCEEMGGRMSIVLFPSIIHFDDYPFDIIHERLQRYCDSRHLRYLDLKPTLDSTSDEIEDLVVNKYDDHPNELANDYVAQAINNFLLD